MKKRASLLTVAVFLFLSLSLLCHAEEIRKYTNKIGMEFSYIPLGQFDMGSTSPEAGSDEQPVHKSTITKGFWMAKHEVTQGLWKQVMGTNPSENKKGDDYPVENVSWKDAQKFLKKLGSMTGEKYRLPTEAEWEFAARAGSSKERPDGVEDQAWFYNNSEKSTHPIGSKAPNFWGLFDMLGNVMEWCSDWYGPYGNEASMDSQGPSSGNGKVTRGGSFRHGLKYIRFAARSFSEAESFSFDLGLRVCKDQ